MSLSRSNHLIGFHGLFTDWCNHYFIFIFSIYNKVVWINRLSSLPRTWFLVLLTFTPRCHPHSCQPLSSSTTSSTWEICPTFSRFVKSVYPLSRDPKVQYNLLRTNNKWMINIRLAIQLIYENTYWQVE